MSANQNLVPLGDVADFVNGVAFAPNDWATSGTPIVRIQNLTGSSKITNFTNRKVSERNMAFQGDLLVSWSATLGVFEWQGEPSCVNQHIFKVIADKKRVDLRYLRHALTNAITEMETHVHGATMKHITRGRFLGVKIHLPPTLDEQKRIAAVLDKADALRRQRQESLQLTEKLLQSVFIDMFVRNPDAANWTPRSVEWMAKDTKGSMRTGPFGSQLLHSEFVDSGIAVLGIDNAVKNRFEWGQPRFITPKKYESLKRYKVFPGDLIITIMGTLGRCAIVPDDIPEAINTKHLCCITLEPKKCLPEFLHAAFLHHPEVLRQLGVRSKGAVMPGLNMGIIKELVLPLPPVELQKEFKRVVGLCGVSQMDQEVSQESADDLFGSLQQRAFRGDLDVSRVFLEEEAEAIIKAADDLHELVHYTLPKGLRSRSPHFIANAAAAQRLKQQREQVKENGQIPWSEEYWHYAILGEQPQPFRAADVLAKAMVFDDETRPSDDDLVNRLFAMLAPSTGPAKLKQRFDHYPGAKKPENRGTQEIVLEHAT